ncbi:hypothetical protein EAE99_000019 [Botrytis elliptica]|nr:hypothetical protein EAE99_000019 [Botrytis elliptica]
MHGQNSNSYDEYGNTQTNYTGFPPSYIPPNNPPSHTSHSDSPSQQPSQPQLLEPFQQQQPLEECQESFGQHNSFERRQLHQPQTFIQQQAPSQYLMPQPSSKPLPYSLPSTQSSQVQSMPQSQPFSQLQDPIGLDVMNFFEAQSQSSVQSHPQMPMDFSSDSLQNFEMLAMYEVENRRQDIVPNLFGAQASLQNDASGQDTYRLSRSHLGSTDTIGIGSIRDLVSAFRDRLLSRSYFVFRWSRDLERTLSTLISEALDDVHTAISQMWPTFSESNIKQAHSLSFAGQETFVVFCEDLMFIYNKRVSGIADSIGIQPLLNHIYSTGKKVILMSRDRGTNSRNRGDESRPRPSKNSDIYIWYLRRLGFRRLRESLQEFWTSFKGNDDQMLRTVMEDLLYKANDMVLIRNNGYGTEPTILDGILLVDIQTRKKRPPVSCSTLQTQYKVDSHTTLTNILTRELLVEDVLWKYHLGI